MANIRKSHKYEEKSDWAYNKPSEYVQSEGDLLIKNLVDKQTNTNIQLHEQLTRKNNFQKSIDLVEVVNITSGKTSLQEFQDCSEFIDTIDELKYYNLTPYEIKLYINSKKGNEFLFKTYKNIPKNTLLQQLEDVRTKIKKHKNCDTKKIDDSVSRHFKEIGLAVKPDSTETKLYKFALSASSSKKEDIISKDHPINHLKELEIEIFGHLDKPKVPSLAKRRKILRKLETTQEEIIDLNIDTPKKLSTKWDIKIMPPSENVPSTSKSEVTTESPKIYSCQKPSHYTIIDSKIVKITNNSETDKEYTKLSDEEIRNIPRFQNYERGTPTKVLYVKNIANPAKNDFLNIFNSLNEENKSECKLLTGKMKGQAFLTFKSEMEATNALDKYNGYILNGKPIIMQYGKIQ